MDKRQLPADQQALIGRIADRTAAIAHRYGVPYDRATAEQDVTAVHAGTELDLQAMLDATDDELAGDMFRIRRTIDRDTGRLPDDFKPHFAARPDGAAKPSSKDGGTAEGAPPTQEQGT